MVTKWLNSRWNKVQIQFFGLEYRDHVVATNLIWLNVPIIVIKKLITNQKLNYWTKL